MAHWPRSIYYFARRRSSRTASADQEANAAIFVTVAAIFATFAASSLPPRRCFTTFVQASIRLRSFESSTSPSLCCCCSVPALSQLRQCHGGPLTSQFRDRHSDFCDRHRDFRIALATPSPLPRTSVTDCDKHCRSVTCAATVAKIFLSFSRLSLRLSRLSLRLPRPSLAFSHCCRRSLEHP